jgi:hypothetical protein
MGDADGTYDFKETPNFTKKMNEGYEFVMGTRTKGWVEKGSRPPLHQYFGAPITNWIFNFVFGSKFSDIHCGLRAMTKDALIKMDLKSQSWEYASEMIVKSIQMKFKTMEVPIRFYKDKHGRVPHLQQGWLTPWKAGWISLRFMFIHKADFFLFKPGIALMIIGLVIVIPLSFGPFLIFSLYSMLLGMTVSILGLIAFSMGILAQISYDYSGERTKRWLRVFEYDRAVILSLILFVIGVLLITPLLHDYFSYGFRLPVGIKTSYYPSVTGLLLIIASFINFTFSLLLNAVSERIPTNIASPNKNNG